MSYPSLNGGHDPEEDAVSIVCLIKGCDWMVYPPQMLGTALLNCERCERCGALRYHRSLLT